MQKRIAYRRMNAISLISREKVDRLLSILSSLEILVKILWTMGKDAYSAGTKLPI